jgi:DNA polymerase-1
VSKRIILIDGSGIIFRAHYSLIRRPLYTSKGKNTSAIFGYLRMLFKLFKDEKPDAVGVAFDVSRKSFRTDMFPDYKANRDETPEELKEQIPQIIELTKMMGIPVFAREGVEADDVIGTFAEHLKDKNEVTILTGDKDLFQLVDNKVRVLGVIKGVSETRLLDREGVKELKGVYPEQIPDFIGMVGDSSDNIPGVKGIGEKGASALLAQYPSLEAIYENIDSIKGAIQAKLIEYKDSAFLSKRLAIIKRDVDFDDTDILSVANSHIDNIYNDALVSKIRELEMPSILKEIGETPKSSPKPSYSLSLFDEEIAENKLISMDGKYYLVTSNAVLDSLIDEIYKQKSFCLDFETDAKSVVESEIIGVAVALKEKEAYYIPVKHDIKTEFNKQDLLNRLKPVFEDKNIAKIGQNLKFETEILLNYGINLQGLGFDTMVGAYLIDPSQTHYSLDNLAERILSYKTVKYAEVVIDTKLRTLLDADIEKVKDYAGEDADIALRLKSKLEQKIKDFGLQEVLYNIEMPLIPVLAVMEHNGVKIDTAYLKRISVELGDKIYELEKRIYLAAGDEFNINSTKQLRTILFDKLGLPVNKKTPTKQASTDEQTLKELANIHPLPALLLEYRTYTKLKTTYVDALPQIVNKKSGRIHTSFNQTVTTTGRLSSSDPNLQNIPIRDELGRRIRGAFVAEDGFTLVSADYSQIELRLFAHLSKDNAMQKAFGEGADIHSITASVILGKPIADITQDDRRLAKTINYGISYGMGPFKLSRDLGITMDEARNFIDNYFSKFPGMRQFMQEVIESACQNGEVRTMFGRRRPVPELLGKKFRGLTSLNHAERFSINTVVQGSAADIMKLAMIEIHKTLPDNFSSARMILQIHDELLFEVPDNETDKFTAFVRDKMENVVKLDVKLIVDTGMGKNWSEAH